MPNIAQIRTVFSGVQGSPGYCQMYFDQSGSTLGPQSASDAVRAFWNGVAVQMPTAWRFTLDADVEILDDSTGDLVSIEPTTPLAQNVFGDSPAWFGGAGCSVKWITGAVHGTRRLTGRTYIVPLNSGKCDTDGSIAAATVTAVRAAAATLQGHADFGVWGRPVGGANGLFAKAVAYNARDYVSILRSRRD